MTVPCFSLNVNGNWIEVESEGFWKPKVITRYNGEPVITERWTEKGKYEFTVDEKGTNVQYELEMTTVVRDVAYVVRRNGNLLLVTEWSRSLLARRESKSQ